MNKALALLLGLFLTATVSAAQYQSQSRVVTGPIVAPPSIDEVAADARRALAALDSDPYAKSLLLQELAAHAIKGDNNGEAIAYYEELLKLSKLAKPALLPARYNLAQLYFANEQYAKTTLHMQRYFREGGRATAKAWVLMGSAYIKQKKYRLAKRPLQSAIDSLDGGKQEKEHEDWFRLLLAVYLKTKDKPAAIKLLRQMVRNFPDKIDYWSQLSALQLQYKKKYDAIATMELAHRMGVLSTEDDYLRFARLFMHGGAPYFGAVLIERWMKGGQLEQSPTNMSLLAQAWMQAREERKAAEALDRANKLNPTAQQWLQLGQLHIQLRSWRSAERALVNAIRSGVGKQTGPAWVSLGLARYQLRKLSGAREAFETASKYSASASHGKQWLEYLDDIAEVGLESSAVGMSADSELLSESGGEEDTGGLFQEGTLSLSGDGYNADSAIDLTPVGAERGANPDGSIPVWRGGLKPGEVSNPIDANGGVTNPFVDEEPIFVITKENMAEYSDKLSEGHQFLLSNYDGYQMPVYTTRRSAGYPQEIYDATLANEPTARLIGSDSLRDASLGFPFRKPVHGAQAMWNHRVRYRGNSAKFRAANFVVRKDGGALMSRADVWVYFDYGNIPAPGGTGENNILLYFMSLPVDPIAARGSVILSHDTIDTALSARKLWFKPPSFKLVRAPSIGYDFPDPSSDGISYVDQIDMYNGAFDRYDWRIIGKRELYIPYNAYQLSDKGLRYDQVLDDRFLDPQNTRYELHRVWLVEAAKRSGESHHFRKRRFYLDEDTWGVVIAENYNATNRLWKFQEGHSLYRHQEQATVISPQVVYDFTDGRYFVSGLNNEEAPAVMNDSGLSPSFFTPSQARRLVR